MNYLELIAKDIGSNLTTWRYIADDYNTFRYLIYSSDNKSTESAKANAKQYNMTYINAQKSMTDLGISSYITIQTEYYSNYSAISMKGDNGTSTVLVRFYDSTTNNIVEVNPNNKITMEIESTLQDMNDTLYLYFISKGLDIYNIEDPAFTDPCYINKRLEYDLSQKYRKQDLFQGKYLKPAQECLYEGANLETQRLLFKCNFTSNQTEFYHFIKGNLTDQFEISNLVIMCPNKIYVLTNIAFWLYLICLCHCIIMMIGIYMYMTIYSPGNIEYWLMKDNIKFHQKPVETIGNITEYNKEVIQMDDISPDIIVTKSFKEVFIHNLISLHSITTLFNLTITKPLFLKVAIFFFNIFCIFGFNALYYTENNFDMRMTDDFRDNFAYPMKSEFDIIISSIVTTMALTMIIKAVNYVSEFDKEELSVTCQKANNINQAYQGIKDFWRKGLWKRILSYILMILISGFLCYYSVVFCGIYIKTQYTWSYSGVWAILLNWVLFCPFSILIISAIELSSETCANGVKQVFWF